MRILILSLAIALFLLTPEICWATHLRAGEIQVRRIDCNSLTVEITLVIYVNTIGTSTNVGGIDDFLSLGDGSAKRLVPEIANQTIDPLLGIGKTVYKLVYTYNSPGHYLISYSEPNRNEGVVNMDLSANTRFQIEAMVVLEANKCNTYPIFLNAPIDRACHKSAFFHNPGGFDADGDSLSYELAIPKKDDTTPVANYRNPNHPSFYPSFNQGNESGTGTPTFHIDPITGLLTWDAPGVVGEYSVAIKMREWKKDSNGNWFEYSYIIRDMQILVAECDNRKPELNFQEEICVVAGEQLKINLRATDADGDSVRAEFFSELLSNPDYKPSISPATDVGKFRPSPLDLTFNMNTSCEQARSKPYLLTVKVSDQHKGSTSLSRYYTFKIYVIPPPPKIEAVVVNPVSKQVLLQWSIPPCQTVQSYQVWRRTSSISYDETACAKGMPGFLRYDLLAIVPQTQKMYTDVNLEIGSQYCYRIVAVVAGNIPGKLSLDTCLIPKSAEAPVITNVSVEETDDRDGKISVRWTPPFEIDKTQYPPPYKYQVFRKNETLDTPYEKIGGLQSDTMLSDELLNTKQHAYRYWIELYVTSLSNLPLDSSSQASSIVPSTESKVGQIDLRWSAKTPWSNYSEKHPYHLIFRGSKTNGPFELIDSVNVLGNGFEYSDRGQYKNQGLARDPYFYKIKTRGTYGNPGIDDPLENYSPIVFGQVLDTIPPCLPIVKMQSINCNQFSCDGKSYYTLLQWQSSDEACDQDVVAYEVLVKADTATHYSSLAIITETMYRHGNLTNLDYCYRIISIDHVGNRSDSSAAICNTSCLNFKLPNVITPATVDEQNDYLTAYDGENSSEDHCARSVRQVQLFVYNRWGDEVFLKAVNNQETNILWPGINNAGEEVSAGTYYYKANVDFQTNDPSKRKQEIKGWVHVLR